METSTTAREELYWCLKETSDGVPLPLLRESLQGKLSHLQIDQVVEVSLKQGTIRLDYVREELRLWLTEEKRLPQKQPKLSDKLAWFIRSHGRNCDVKAVYAEYCGRQGLQPGVVSASLAELLDEQILSVTCDIENSPSLHVALVHDWQFTVIATDKNARVRCFLVRGGSRELVEKKVHHLFSSMRIILINQGVLTNWMTEGGARIETEAI